MFDSKTELMQYISDDIQKYDNLSYFVKASLLERLLFKKRPPKLLHPNPIDEFSTTDIGPHFEIINHYCMKMAVAERDRDEKLTEPLIVEKIGDHAYMILIRYFVRQKHIRKKRRNRNCHLLRSRKDIRND